jgi:3'(2'), 5'-bisphosphate nucleotidase
MDLRKRDIEDILLVMKEASEAVLALYKTELKTEKKADGSYVTNADKASSEILMEHLKKSGLPIICEEEEISDYETRKDWPFHWSVDPLDGTKGYVKQSGEFAICVALIKGNSPHFGFIADPLRGQVLFGGNQYAGRIWKFTDKYFDFDKIHLNELDSSPLKYISSRSSEDQSHAWVSGIFGDKADNIQKSSALKFFKLAHGEADVYPRFLPSMEWDISAGHAILLSLGGDIVESETSNRLEYNKKSLFNSNFIAKTASFTTKELALNK